MTAHHDSPPAERRLATFADPDIERAVLACCLYQQVLPSTLNLTGTDFYSPDHEALWNVLGEMEQAGETIDAIVADGRLRARVERPADPDLVVSLAGGSELAANAGIYADDLRKSSRRRHALAVVRQAEQRLTQGEDPAEVLDAVGLEALTSTTRSCPARRGQLVDPDAVRSVRHEWVKKDWYPCDVVTVLAGHGGEGKSSFSLADVAAGSRGELHGRCAGRPVRSVIVATEDTQSDQKLRLRAAGAVFEHVRFYTVANPKGEELRFDLTRDLPGLREAADGFGADLLVIDPLSSVVPGDLNKTDVIRAALDPLSAMARDLHLAVVVVHHFNKGQGNASRKMTGSEAIRDTVRSAIFFAHDKESGERVLSFDKGNYSTLEGRNYSYELISAPAIDDAGHQMFDEEGNPETVPLVRILEETDNSVEKIINTAPQGQDGEDSRSEALNFMIGYLCDHGGEVPAGDVLKAGRAAGFDDKQLCNTRQRSKDPHIESRRATSGNGWVWAVEDSLDTSRTHASVGESSEFSNESSRESRSQSDLPRFQGESSNEGLSRGESSSPSVTPSGEPDPPAPAEMPTHALALVPDDPCPVCTRSLTQTDGTRLCKARHRRAQEIAS